MSISPNRIKEARRLRKIGQSHSDIAKNLHISKSAAFNHTKDIHISYQQHLELIRRGFLKMRKLLPKSVLVEAARRGGQNTPTKFKPKYSRTFLIDAIKKFYQKHKRIPTKREFNSRWQCYLKHFGSWNKAVIIAGFKPNPELFSKKWIAKDSHKCDSLSEKIIDDLLYKLDLPHERNIFYPRQKKFTVDFLVNGKIWVEFLGLKNELRSYDRLVARKRRLAERVGIKILEIHPKDLFPIENLESRLKRLRM